jgi:uncharacterized membrane protein YeaQ/YmgE (transglycosylase-associated protein family)
MDSANFTDVASVWAHQLLLWIGFGTVVGLVAKAIMPGRDPGGTLATLLMGIAGSVIGCGVVAFFSEGTHITPLSPLGFVVATAGAFVLLFFYRLLSGRFYGEGPQRSRGWWSFGRPRRKVSVIEDE